LYCALQIVVLLLLLLLLLQTRDDAQPTDNSGLELCADELVVGGGVGWSYVRRRRRAAHFSSRRRRRGFMVGGGGVGAVRPDERAMKQRTRRTGVFFLVLQVSATSPVISAGPLVPIN